MIVSDLRSSRHLIIWILPDWRVERRNRAILVAWDRPSQRNGPPSHRRPTGLAVIELAALAAGIDELPVVIDYTDVEHGVWAAVSDALHPLWDRHAADRRARRPRPARPADRPRAATDRRRRLAPPTDRVRLPRRRRHPARRRVLPGAGTAHVPLDAVRALGGLAALHARARRDPRGDGPRQLPRLSRDRRPAPARRRGDRTTRR